MSLEVGVRKQTIGRLGTGIEDAQNAQIACRLAVIDLTPDQVCVYVVYCQQRKVQVGKCWTIEIRILECRVFARDISESVIPQTPVAGDCDQVFEIVGDRLPGAIQICLRLVKFELVKCRRYYAL